MINLESHDTLGIKMENPTQKKLQQLPHPPFFMDPKKALPFWLVRSLQDKMPMVSIPEKVKVPYTRGLVGENLVQSLDPNEFVPLDPTESRVEYAPLHDKNLKKFFKSPNIRKMVEKTGDLVDGRTACTLKEYNDYRRFVHKMLLNHVTQEQREEEQLKAQELDVDNFLRAAKKEGKDKWNKRFKEYLKQKNLEVVNQSAEAKLKRCAERLQRGEKAYERVKQMCEKTQELRKAKWVAYKKRMDNYFKAIKDDKRRRGIYARKRWMMEAVINQHRKSLNLVESRLKRELVMETNWNRRMAGQKLKLKKDIVVREQYNASIQLMKSRREKYYNRRDVEIDELLALPGMNSLDELEVFNTQFDQFSPEFLNALHGAKFYMNRSTKSLTLDKSLRKYIQHHESATERMKKANVARPIRHALDLLIRRSVGYYAMVLMHKTIMEATPMALHLADKIESSTKLRELLLEEYKQFGPRSDTPFQTVKKFQEDGLSHCMCDYALIHKDTMEWPCPLCRTVKDSSYVSEESSESSTCSLPEQGEEVYIIGEGTTTVGFLVPPRITEGQPEMVFADTAVEVEPMVVEDKPGNAFAPAVGGLVAVPKEEEEVKEPDFVAQIKAESPIDPVSTKSKKGSKTSKGSKKSKKGSKEETKRREDDKRKGSKGSLRSKKSNTSKKSRIPIEETKGELKLEGSVAEKHLDVQAASSEAVEPLPKPPMSGQSEEKEKRKRSKRISQPSSEGLRQQKKPGKEPPKNSILKRKATQKQPKKKGVSFAETTEFQKAVEQSADPKFSSIESVSLVRTSVSQSQLLSRNQPPAPPRRKVGKALSVNSSHSQNADEGDEMRSKSSIVSLLSITSDDRLHFVKGQCVHTKRGSKFGKVGTGTVQPQQKSGVKRGFLKGTCKCFFEQDTPSKTSQISNITERLDESVSRQKKVSRHLRWRGVKVDKDISSPMEDGEHPIEEPIDLNRLLSTLPEKKRGKIRYLLRAQDLKVVCHCKKCFPGESAGTDSAAPGKPDTNSEQSAEAAEVCQCRLRQQLKSGPQRQNRLAYMTKIIGKNKVWRDSNDSDTKSVKSRKMSAKSMLERHKSIISRLWKKKSLLEVKGEPISRREPDVQKYYVDDLGNLYVLNRYGIRTHLKNVGRDFKIDEKGRKYFIDEDTRKKYLIDVTGRVYLENEDGDIQSLFYEDGKEYQDPEPKKLLLHYMVRGSVVDLLNEMPQENFFDDEDDLVELIYEYLFEGSEESVATEQRPSEVKSDELEPESGDEEAVSKVRALGVVSSKMQDEPVGPRMPIKRPLNSLIKEVPFNREISKLFIQRKKFHDCAAIVFRRTLLYSLATYTKIMDRGFDSSSEIVGKKKITGLDGMVKGLTKITAHYPLKLIKSKRLSPYVDALVHGFLGSEGYRIFPGRTPVFRTPSTPDSSGRDSSQTAAQDSKKPRKIRLSEVDGVDEMKQICLCGKDNASVFIEKNAFTVPISELMKVTVCKKNEQ